MQTKIIFVVGCVFFLITTAVAIAGSSKSVAPSEVTIAAVHVDNAGKTDKDPELQKWLQGIKPAAGVNYWEKKVVRRSSRKITKGNE